MLFAFESDVASAAFARAAYKSNTGLIAISYSFNKVPIQNQPFELLTIRANRFHISNEFIPMNQLDSRWHPNFWVPLTKTLTVHRFRMSSSLKSLQHVEQITFPLLYRIFGMKSMREVNIGKCSGATSRLRR